MPNSSGISGLPLRYYDSNQYELLVAGRPFFYSRHNLPEASSDEFDVFGKQFIDNLVQSDFIEIMIIDEN